MCIFFSFEVQEVSIRVSFSLLGTILYYDVLILIPLCLGMDV